MLEERKPLVERVAWIDILKFLGIYCIYLGHFTEAGGPFYLFVFTFHVQLFFFVGGFYVSRPVSAPNSFIFLRREIAFIKEKAKQLLIPYYCCSLITIGLLMVQNYAVWGMKELPGFLWEMLLGRREHLIAFPLWFFTCFFVVSILYRWLLLLLRSPWVVLIPALALNLWNTEVLSFLHIEPLSLPFNLDSAWYYLVYFCAGNCLYPILRRIWEARKKFFVPILLTGILLAVFSAGVFFYGQGFTQKVFEKLHFATIFGRMAPFIQTMLLILLFVMLAMALSRVKFLAQMGRHSLTLCATELMTKTLLTIALMIIGVYISDLMTTVRFTLIYTGFCCFISDRVFARFIPEKFPKLAPVFGIRVERAQEKPESRREEA
jgi:fucose 4-O-acetylase-like acetyltransferase